MKYKYATLVVSHPRSLEALIFAKDASTKNLVKGLNTYVNVMFLLVVNQFAKMLKKAGVLWVDFFFLN